MSVNPLEKHDHNRDMELESTPYSKNNICRDSQLHHPQNAQDNWATMPKRKPVATPSTTAPSSAAPITAAATDKEHVQPSTYRAKRTWPLFELGGFDFKSQKRSRKIIIIGILAIALIALIIGLAVGLTVGRYARL